jgi:acetylornithine deacetylase
LCYGPRRENHYGFNERAHLPTLQKATLAIAAFIADWCGVRERPAPGTPPT